MAKKKTATKKSNKNQASNLKYWVIGIVVAVIVLGVALNYSSKSSTSDEEGALNSIFNIFRRPFIEPDPGCKTDDNCLDLNGPGYICKYGICVLESTCSRDADCKTGEICTEGACVPVLCTKYSDCDAKTSCIGGLCVPNSPVCKSDDDCASGTFCNAIFPRDAYCLECRDDAHCSASVTTICTLGVCVYPDF